MRQTILEIMAYPTRMAILTLLAVLAITPTELTADYGTTALPN